MLEKDIRAFGRKSTDKNELGAWAARAAPGWRRDWIQQYNLLRGRVWVLVLLALLFAPILVHNWFIA